MVSDRSLSILGWCFDLFTVSISVTDVVADLLVAVQFLQEGHTLWAWLVLGFFFNSTVVYAVILTGTMMNVNNSEFQVNGFHILPTWMVTGPKFKKFLLVLPFAQLAPSGMYLAQTFLMPWLRKRANDTFDERRGAVPLNYETATASDPTGEEKAFARVDHDEAEQVADTFLMMGRLREALERQIVTHGMLLAETLVESVPQSIVQLLAMTFLGTPSYVQSISLALSLLSVVTKAYFVSLSCDFKMFVFKFATVAFDVMSMFYIFATVLSSSRSSDVALFGDDSLRVSYLAYAWIVKLVVQVGFTLFVAFLLFSGACIYFWFRVCRGETSCSAPSSRELRDVFGVFLLCCMLFLPAVMLLEAMKVSWLLFFMFRLEPSIDHVPTAAILYGFLERAPNAKDAHRRVVHLFEVHSAVNFTRRMYVAGPNRALLLAALPMAHMDLLEQLHKAATTPNPANDYNDDDGGALSNSYNSQRYYLFSDLRRQSLQLCPLAKDVIYSPDYHPFGYVRRQGQDPYYYSPQNQDYATFDFLHARLKEVASEEVLANNELQRQSVSSLSVILCASLFEKETDRTVRWYRTVRDAALQGRDEHGQLLAFSGPEYLKQRLEGYVLAPQRLRQLLSDCMDRKVPLELRVAQAENGDEAQNILILTFYVWLAVDVLCVLVSLAFPFVSVAMDYNNQNLLQWLCFGSSCILLLIMLVTGLWVPSYLRLVQLVSGLLVWCSIDSPNDAQKQVVRYFETTPKDAITYAACASASNTGSPTLSVLTPEMLFNVASFLHDSDVVTKDLTVTECLAMKASVEQLLFNGT